MKRTAILGINTSNIFEIIQNYYKANFPYSCEWEAITAINLAFKNSSYGRVVPGFLKKMTSGRLYMLGNIISIQKRCSTIKNTVSF